MHVPNRASPPRSADRAPPATAEVRMCHGRYPRARAAAGLLGRRGLVRRGAFGAGANVVFVHTGGTPAPFACTGMFEDL